MLKKVVFAVLASCAMSAFAADNQTNFYAGVDVGSTKIDSVSGRMGSLGGFVGYEMTKNWSIEGGYRRIATLELLGADVDMKQTAISLIGTADLGNNFDIFGRIGYNRVTASASYAGRKGSASDSGSLFGLGVAYNVNNSFSVRLEATRPGQDTTNVGLAALWKF